jgi:hypothetical protein
MNAVDAQRVQLVKRADRVVGQLRGDREHRLWTGSIRGERRELGDLRRRAAAGGEQRDDERRRESRQHECERPVTRAW